jgi:hypothetical protein
MKITSVLAIVALATSATCALAGPLEGETAKVSSGRAIGMIIYKVSGVTSRGTTPLEGSSTAVICTNLSGSTVTMEMVWRDHDEAVVSNINFQLDVQDTKLYATKHTEAFFEDVTPATPPEINQGFVVVRSTSRQVICSAMVVDAAAAAPSGIALHMVRYNAINGSVE